MLAALAELSRHLGALAVAPLYRSGAVSPIPQPPFLNSVALVYSDVPPLELLALAQELERAAGRVPGPHWGPRALDIDLLVVGDCRQPGADPGGAKAVGTDLVLPHPRLRERSFVLAPLADLAPDLALPPDGRTAAELLARLPRDPTLRRVPWTSAE